MRSPLLSVLISGVLVVTAADAVRAQPPRGGVNPAARPKFSPYLNLTRTDVDPALNYYGLVRPQVNFFNSIQQLDQQQSALGDRMTQEFSAPSGLPATGHTAGFLNHSKYFFNRGGVGMAGGGQPAVAAGVAVPTRGRSSISPSRSR